MNKKTKNEDFLPINGTDYVEFYVGNAKQAAYFYQSAFGFESLAYKGLETGSKDKTSYALRQGKVILVLSTALHKESEINNHYTRHGDGVKVVALNVDDANSAYTETIKRGAASYMEPTTLKDNNGEVILSGIYTYGETVHLFVERKNYKGTFMPGFTPLKSNFKTESTGIKYIDHIVGNVGWNQMNKWTDFYRDVMGFHQLVSFDDKDISTEYTALMSKVMSNGNEKIKFPINEPAEGKKKSQIEEYLDFYQSAGVQHIALATDNIIDTVATMRDRGIEFLRVPDSYYEMLSKRVGHINEDITKIRDLGILVDRDDEGYLLQIFTKPVQDRPTLFFEIIQREGAKSFGKGNFQALFESIEIEQAKRGTL
ncbi:MAG: 4-hydroxyphenylpyruvate dioxygenase [Hyphomicrobiales bacterium]